MTDNITVFGYEKPFHPAWTSTPFIAALLFLLLYKLLCKGFSYRDIFNRVLFVSFIVFFVSGINIFHAALSIKSQKNVSLPHARISEIHIFPLCLCLFISTEAITISQSVAGDVDFLIFLISNKMLYWSCLYEPFSPLDTPLRVKRLIVEAHEIHARWQEEAAFLKKEMGNFIQFYVQLFSDICAQIKETKESING